MSVERLAKVIDKLPKGYYVHRLNSFVNGKVSTTKKGTAKLPIEIGIEQLGSPFDDLRAVLDPMDNKLIPLLVFVDLDEVETVLAAAPEPPCET